MLTGVFLQVTSRPAMSVDPADQIEGRGRNAHTSITPRNRNRHIGAGVRTECS